ncbi:carbohydrate esterase family 3 protein [Xylaria palmicola]|nr:carbohydrate esterase family 3 protein [Xylaria palmicola]
MGGKLGTLEGPGWRGYMGTILVRRNTALVALLLITISLAVVYSFHNAIELDKLPYNETPDTSGLQYAAEAFQQAEGLSDSLSSDKLPISRPLVNADTLDITHGETPATKLNFDQGLLTSGPLSTPLGSHVPLRVMFLGASVTRGDVSVGNLGFRSPLRDKLVALGSPVNFVGSQRLGAFKDNDLEAYPGNRIDQIHDHATRIVPKTKPNVFVLHIGSNDCLQKHNTADAGKRMRDLTAYLLKTSPRATIILSTLLTNTVPGKELCILDLNIQIRKLASALQREGRPVVLAEMHYEQGLPDRPLPGDISPDGTHPFDHGYGLMADIFFSALLEADRRGFLKTPEENGIPDDGESERADERFVFEPEPPKKQPTRAKDGPGAANAGESKDVPTEEAPKITQKPT